MAIDPNTVQAVGSNIIVLVDEQRETTSSGNIIIPETARLRKITGTIIAVGPGWRNPVTKKFIPHTVKVGQRVMFGVAAGEPIWSLKEGNYRKIKETQILAIMKPKPAVPMP